MARPKASDNEGIKRAADVVPPGSGVQFEGEKIETKELLGIEVKLLGVSEPIKSSFGEGSFIVMQVEVDGEKRVAMSGATVLVKKLSTIPQEELPVLIKLVKVKGQSGRPYLSYE